MNFKINDKGVAEGFCLVKSSEKRVSAKGGAYLDIILADKTGEINGKIWDYDEQAFGVYEAGDLVKVRGLVSKYNGVDQIKIDRIRKAMDMDGVSPADFAPQAAYEGDVMYDELISVANAIENTDVKAIVLEIYKENKEKLLYWPAAFKLHHAIRCGLLMHVLSIVRLCEKVCEIYPSINKDLLIAGAMLHDIGKLFEYDVNSVGTANGYTVEGNLIGHLVKGAIIIEKTAEKLGIGGEVPMLLQHMMISHHGEPEFGASVRPSFIEAEILSSLDTLDAKIYEMAEAVSSVETGDFSGKLWALDNRKLYNHGMNAVETTVKLFEE